MTEKPTIPSKPPKTASWAFINHRTQAEIIRQEELEGAAKRADIRVGSALDRARTP